MKMRAHSSCGDDALEKEDIGGEAPPGQTGTHFKISHTCSSLPHYEIAKAGAR